MRFHLVSKYPNPNPNLSWDAPEPISARCGRNPTICRPPRPPRSLLTSDASRLKQPLLSSPLYLTTNHCTITSDDDTVSTLAIAPDNLTDIGIIGGQDITHEQRKTNLGLVVRETNLPGCKPTPPGKRSDISWIWQHGHKVRVRNKKEELVPHWLCKACYTKAVNLNPSKKVTTTEFYFMPANPTTNGSRHMEDVHNYRSDGTVRTEPPKKRTITEALGAVDAANNRTFDRPSWQSAHTKFIARSGISLRDATSEDFRELLIISNPQLEHVVPQSHLTAHRWVIDAYTNAKPQVIQSIANAQPQAPQSPSMHGRPITTC